MARLVPGVREMLAQVLGAYLATIGPWRGRSGGARAWPGGLAGSRRPGLGARRWRPGSRQAGPMDGMQRLFMLVRALAILQAVMASPVGRRAMDLNRKASHESKLLPHLPLARSRTRKNRGVSKPLVGLLAAMAIGATVAALYSAKRRRDTRRALADSVAQSEMGNATGSILEPRLVSMQAQLEQRSEQVRERVAGVSSQATDAVTIETVHEANHEGTPEPAVDAVTPAAESAAASTDSQPEA